jgi:hypothetical protein
MRPRYAVLFVLVLAVGGILPCRAWSATYYVSASGGNNANSCAASQNTTTPRQTVTAGIACLSGGDTLIVKDGSYPEYLEDLIPSGSSGSPTTIRAEHARQAILTPQTGSPTQSGILIGLNQIRQWITIDGIVVDAQNTGRSGMGVRTPGDSTPVHAGSHDVTLQNVEIKNIPNDNNPCSSGSNTDGMGFDGAVYRITVRNSHIHDIGTGAVADPNNCGPNHIFYSYCIYTSAVESVFENNEMDHCSSYSFHNFAADTYGSSIYRGNFIHHNGGPALIACPGDNNQVYNNIFWQNGIGPFNPQRGALLLGGSCKGTPTTGNQVYNNTFYQNVGDGGVSGCIALSYSGAVAVNNTIIRNNICYQNTPADIIQINNGTGTVQDHNLLGTNPVFASASPTVAADFQLTPGSVAALESGVATALFSTDYAGITRPQPAGGIWDIGAYEYVTGGSSGVPTSGHWKFDEGGGTSALDSSGNGNTGTLIGGPTYVPGRVGPYALAFNGTTAVVTAPVANNPQYTWAHLVKATQPPSTTAVMHTLTNGNDQTEPFSFAWGHDTASFRQAAAHQAINGNYYAAQIPSPLSANVWYHIAGTYDGTTLRVYLNGVLQATTPGVPAPLAPTGSLYMGGGSRPNTNFAGSIDDVLLYQRALTDPEILALYQSTLGSVRHRITSQ